MSSQQFLGRSYLNPHTNQVFTIKEINGGTEARPIIARTDSGTMAHWSPVEAKSILARYEIIENNGSFYTVPAGWMG